MSESQNKKKGDKKNTFLNKYQEIFPTNPTWGRIQYLIQMSYTNVSINLKQLYIVGNKGMETKFNSHNENKRCVEVIISENQLNKAEEFASICDKGFKDILSIEYGKLDMNRLQKKDSQDFFQVMVCKAAIGHTYIEKIKSHTETVPFEEKPQLMSEQFDSVLVYDENLGYTDFRQHYIFYEPEVKCLPEYIARFSVNTNKYRQLQEKINCELCDDNIARKYCKTQDAHFCISCDNLHHQNRLAYKHIRTDLNEKPKILGKCPNHLTLELELFCLECNRPICINCKVKGDHSSGEMLTHTFIRIQEKYEQTEKMLKEVDSNLEKRKSFLSNSMKVIESKLKDINKKNVELQDKIYELMDAALRQLQKITKKKMALLMSDHLELKRQYDEIQWMERYLEYQQKVLTPNDFLLSYARYDFKKKDILSMKFDPSKVLPDMRVEGNITVLTEEEARGIGSSQTIHKQVTMTQIGKNNLFRKAEDKNSNVMKSKIQWNEPIDAGKEQILTSKNNLLNLSILKNI